MVEISLTSNDVILGVSGKDHPFPLYRLFGVPVALSSDDEGVSRTDITHEYVRAVQTYDLRYADLKRMVRTSLEHSFLRGRVYGARRMISSMWFRSARRVRWARTSILQGARIFWGPMKRPASNGVGAAFP